MNSRQKVRILHAEYDNFQGMRGYAVDRERRRWHIARNLHNSFPLPQRGFKKSLYTTSIVSSYTRVLASRASRGGAHRIEARVGSVIVILLVEWSIGDLGGLWRRAPL